ncbi:hypothetical protein S40293_03790 [Stachybotrys chartarum IBT 40293]|nr:hypothetical protein S40293_03790 [Stachybotrys chartarum IBT 40293]
MLLGSHLSMLRHFLYSAPSMLNYLPFTLLMTSVVTAAITWRPCDDLPGHVQCANLTVPLDYTNCSNNQTLVLQLVRAPAVTGQSKGSILLNFGGPGATSRQTLATTNPLLHAMTGGQHDLIAFDPRGTGTTIPFHCYDDFGLIRLALEQTASNSSDVALGAIWARAMLDSQTCFETENDTGNLIGTAFVARDMIRVVDALEEDGMLRYWGFSYGTTLGATVSAMFPERVDKVILDGVQNPHEYYHATADFEEWTDSDKVVSAIFHTCLDFPENCALSQQGVGAEELEQQFWNLLWQIKYEPIIVGPFTVDYDLMKLVVASCLYDSSTWPALALLLQGLFTGQSNEAMERVLSAFYPTTYEGTVEAVRLSPPLMGIHCSDRTPRLNTLEELKPTVDRLYEVSRFMGDVAASLQATCVQWRFHAKERYEGDFNVRTANPLLIVNNHFDGHTPLVSAYNVSSGFEGSHVLEVAGYGHASLAVPSLCTVEHISAYFNDGILPDHGYVCNATVTPYSGLGWDDVLDLGAAAGKRAISGTDIGGYRIPRGYAPGHRWLL